MITFDPHLFIWYHFSYLHSKEITHGYVTADTVFIQHDGLIKLGSSK